MYTFPLSINACRTHLHGTVQEAIVLSGPVQQSLRGPTSDLDRAGDDVAGCPAATG